MRSAFFAFCFVSGLAGCGSDDSNGSPHSGTGGSGATGGTSTGGTDAGLGGSSTAGTDSGTGGTLADSGPDGFVPEPTSSDIQFSSTNPLPSGEQLLFTDWNASPNKLSSIKPDGTGELEIFRAYRLWALGASHDTNAIAFACGDPLQLEHYGLNLGDAIQNTWLYDSNNQTAKILSYGNINDECHTFSSTDQSIYVCRRYDFQPDNSNHTYRLGRISLGDGSFEFFGPDLPAELQLHPQPVADESALFYTIIEVQNGSQKRRIAKKSLPDGTPELVKQDASSAVLSPDGTKLVFADTTQQSQLFRMDADGTNVIKVASHNGTSVAWSPDGTRVAYLWSETSSCTHIEIVKADGSEANTPFRVRDCGTAFVADLAWIDRP